jgi:DNA-binding NarL/FixJ family response regulator
LARVGLATLLTSQSNCHVVAQVTNDDELPNWVHVYRPHVLVLDWGTDATRALEHAVNIRDTQVPVVALVSAESDVNDAWRFGARGILPRYVLAEHLTAALTAVSQGLVVIDPGFASALLSPPHSSSAQLAEELTPRESQVLKLMAEGQSNKAIARALGISESTVKFHVNAILGKLNVQSRTEAVVSATRLGLILL